MVTPPQRECPVIPHVTHGENMPNLVSYLFGPGLRNEHVDQHLVAAYHGCAADDRLWESEPGVQRQIRSEARRLGWEVDFPHARWAVEPPQGDVWHCSLSLPPDEAALTDEQWAIAAQTLVDRMGFSEASGRSGCRWVAVRHGPSVAGNDHIHVAVDRIRDDGTCASIYRDFRTVGRVAAELETRFGLRHVEGRTRGTCVPDATRGDREASNRLGDREPLRVRLERRVRACVAAASSEAEFVALAHEHGLVLRPRTAADGSRRVVGYSAAERDGRTARDPRTGKRGPIWFGGGNLASDLSLPRLRTRWEANRATAHAARARAYTAWTGTPHPGPQEPSRGVDAARARAAAASARRLRITHTRVSWHEAAGPVADLLAAAAWAADGRTPGPLTAAARQMARAAQPPAAAATPTRSRLAVLAQETVRDVADVFLCTAVAGQSAELGTVLMMREITRLVDELTDSFTVGREARQARTLTHAGLSDLTTRANVQAAAGLAALTNSVPASPGPTRPSSRETRRRPAMADSSALTHEDDLVALLQQTGMVFAGFARVGIGGLTQPGRQTTTTGRDGRSGLTAREQTLVQQLRAEGITPENRHDAHLYNAFRWRPDGEQRPDGERLCREYAGDEARIICSHMMNEADKAGIDTDRLLTKVVNQRGWYDDPNPAKTPAQILAYRLGRAIQAGRYTLLADPAKAQPTPNPAPPRRAEEHQRRAQQIPFHQPLAAALGTDLWDRLLREPRWHEVATTLQRAHAERRDVPALITHAVDNGNWTGVKQVSSVLLKRLDTALRGDAFPPDAVDTTHAGQHRDAADHALLHMRADDGLAADTDAPPAERDAAADAAQQEQTTATAEDRRADVLYADAIDAASVAEAAPAVPAPGTGGEGPPPPAAAQPVAAHRPPAGATAGRNQRRDTRRLRSVMRTLQLRRSGRRSGRSGGRGTDPNQRG